MLTAPTTRRLRRSARRILVVVDEPCTSPSLCTSVRAQAGSEPLEALVISPARGTVATQWYADEDAARADATQRLRACVACLGRQGIPTRGELVDPDPVEAIADALLRFPADRILIITAPERPSPWLQRSIVERARGIFTQPIEHVVMEAAGDRGDE